MSPLWWVHIIMYSRASPASVYHSRLAKPTDWDNIWWSHIHTRFSLRRPTHADIRPCGLGWGWCHVISSFTPIDWNHLNWEQAYLLQCTFGIAGLAWWVTCQHLVNWTCKSQQSALYWGQYDAYAKNHQVQAPGPQMTPFHTVCLPTCRYCRSTHVCHIQAPS